MTSPPSDDLAAPGQLSTYAQRPIEPDLEALLLAEASAIVRAECGWHLFPDRERTWHLDGTGTCTVLVPTMCLRSVAAVTSDDVALAPTDYSWSSAGILQRRHGGRWSARLRGVTVVGTHGYTTLPPELSAVTLALAARMAASPDGRVQRGVGGTTTSWSLGDGVPGLTLAERRICLRHRLQ